MYQFESHQEKENRNLLEFVDFKDFKWKEEQI